MCQKLYCRETLAKRLVGIVGILVLMFFANNALGEVVIKEEQLKWQDVSHMDSSEVFTNLCAACHGAGGKGDGPAAAALNTGVPDLTILSAKNDGVFPYAHVKYAITGKARNDQHKTIGMPAWGDQFAYVRPSGSALIRNAYSRNQIRLLTAYIQSLQG